MRTYNGEIMPDDFQIPAQRPNMKGVTFVEDGYLIRTARYIITALCWDTPMLILGLVCITMSHMMLTIPLQGVLDDPKYYLAIIDSIYVLMPLGFMLVMQIPIAMSVPLLAGYACMWYRG